MRDCVLVADDDPVQLQEMAEFLRLQKLDVITARDGYEALEKIASERPRILMLDVNMPGWNGVRVAEAARGLNHRVIIMLMTAESEMYHFANLSDCGAVEVFRKPVKLDSIMSFLHSALGQIQAA